MIPRPRGQLVRSFAERGRRKGGLGMCTKREYLDLPNIYATRELGETLMKNGKDVMHCIGCLANAAFLLVLRIDAWM